MKNRVKKYLSFTEMLAANHLSELIQTSGVINMTEFSDEINVTRSVVSSMVKKLAMAGVLETVSLGRNGTYVKVLDTDTWETLSETH